MNGSLTRWMHESWRGDMGQLSGIAELSKGMTEEINRWQFQENGLGHFLELLQENHEECRHPNYLKYSSFKAKKSCQQKVIKVAH